MRLDTVVSFHVIRVSTGCDISNLAPRAARPAPLAIIYLGYAYRVSRVGPAALQHVRYTTRRVWSRSWSHTTRRVPRDRSSHRPAATRTAQHL